MSLLKNKANNNCFIAKPKDNPQINKNLKKFLSRKSYINRNNSFFNYIDKLQFQVIRIIFIIETKDYCITGRANPIFCAVGLR